MVNHPNRNAIVSGKIPDPGEIRDLRIKLRLTQTEAGLIVYSALRTWQHWEQGINGMHPGLWELFRIKTTNLQKKI